HLLGYLRHLVDDRDRGAEAGQLHRPRDRRGVTRPPGTGAERRPHFVRSEQLTHGGDPTGRAPPPQPRAPDAPPTDDPYPPHPRGARRTPPTAPGRPSEQPAGADRERRPTS